MQSALQRPSHAAFAAVPNCAKVSRRPAIHAAAQTKTAEPSTSTKVEDIYIGFEKEDGFGSREGRKGRVVKDDPRKYPGKDDFGFFLGVAGGWAGGEVALKSMPADQVKPAKPASKPAPKANTSGSPAPGKKPIYVGFNKDEIDLRKSGAKGRVVYDDPTKYPDREDVGFIAGATGGFAGGEAGLKQFVETGEIKIRKADAYGAKKQFSPVAVGTILAAAGVAGGALLSLLPTGEGSVKAQLLQVATERNLQYLPVVIVLAGGLVGTVTIVTATQVAMKSFQERAQDSVQRIAITAVFLTAVFLAARAVLES